ncbi:MAG: hypothetical protein NZ921_04440 [Candidatus Caldarchaeum sp.]|nr:hypothetical protein [Candidatus Caldarchaeum sp.]
MLRKAVPLMLVFFVIVGSVQAVDVRDVREVLRSDYVYVSGLITADGGVSPAFDPAGSLRGHVLAGSMIAWIHFGLGDPESLALLNRVAAAVNRRIESEDGVDLFFDSKTIPEAENLVVHLLAADFLAVHYGLTKDSRSKTNMLKLAESLEKRLGWTPITSKARYLVYSSRISYLTGGQPSADDVQKALDDFSQHFMDIVDYSSRSFDGLTSSLTQLSFLLSAVNRAGLDSPTELAALWTVHIDYVVNSTKNIPVSPGNYPQLLRAHASLTYAAENTHFSHSKYAAENAVSLAKNIAAMWKAGDRILYLPVDVLDLYPLDPLIPVERMLAEIQRQTKPTMADMRFPTLLILLSQLGELPHELSAVLSLAIEKMAIKEGYFPVVERGVFRSEEFVNRWWRISLLSTYLALQRAPAVQRRNEVVEIFVNTHPTFLVLLTMLLATAFLYRTGLLKW